MNIHSLLSKYNTHLKCVQHIERVKWGKHPKCSYCNSNRVTVRDYFTRTLTGDDRKTPSSAHKTPKYHCNSCNKDFTVLVGTIFESTRMPLQKWFAMISLMLNARKGISASQLSRDLGITYKTAWYAAMRIRCAMLDQPDMLEGIVEMDEVYIGGKPRKRGMQMKMPDNAAVLSEVTNQVKRGRGTSKLPVVGIVERKGRVVAKLMSGLTSKDLLQMLKRYVNTDESVLMTDEYRAYNKLDEVIEHLTVNHSKGEYVRGSAHTNTIEGFFSIIKNGIRGQYVVLSKKYLPFYLAEFAYKYNRRGMTDFAFADTLENAVKDDKCLVNYKPKRSPKTLAYTRFPKKGNK